MYNFLPSVAIILNFALGFRQFYNKAKKEVLQKKCFLFWKDKGYVTNKVTQRI